MPKLDEQISTLEEKLKQLKLKQQRAEARQRAIETKRERKADTRRKILVGGIVQAKIEQGLMDEKELRKWLDHALTRKDDRALFGLAPKSSLGRLSTALAFDARRLHTSRSADKWPRYGSNPSELIMVPDRSAPVRQYLGLGTGPFCRLHTYRVRIISVASFPDIPRGNRCGCDFLRPKLLLR